MATQPYVAPSYAPTAGPGDTRRRIWRVTLENPLNGPRTATFHEAEVMRDKNGIEHVTNGRTEDMIIPYDDPSKTIELRHPETDELLGKTTLGEVMLMLHSLSRHAQNDRDERHAAATNARIAEEKAAAEAKAAADAKAAEEATKEVTEDQG